MAWNSLLGLICFLFSVSFYFIFLLRYLFEILYYFPMIICHSRKLSKLKRMCPRRNIGTRICNKRERVCVFVFCVVTSKLAFMDMATVCYRCLILAISPMLLSQRRNWTFTRKLRSPFPPFNLFLNSIQIHDPIVFYFCFLFLFLLSDSVVFASIMVLVEYGKIKFLDHRVAFFALFSMTWFCY